MVVVSKETRTCATSRTKERVGTWEPTKAKQLQESFDYEYIRKKKRREAKDGRTLKNAEVAAFYEGWEYYRQRSKWKVRILLQTPDC